MGPGGSPISGELFMVTRFGEDEFGLSEFGGVVEPKEELRVEEDLAVGTVPFELESVTEPEVLLKLALERRRKSLKSLKNGMMDKRSCRQSFRLIIDRKSSSSG